MNNLIYILSDSENFQKEAVAAFKKVNIPQPAIKTLSINEAVQKIAPSQIPAVSLLDISSADKNLLTVVHDVLLKSKDMRFIGAGTPSDVTLVMNLVKTGVKDFIGYPFKDNELNDLISSLEANAPKETKNAKIVTLYSPKGGTGVTLLTANLAVALVRTNPELKRATDPKPTLVVCDFSPQCGDISTYLNINPQYTIRDIIDNHTILDESFLQGVLLPHSSGIQVLASPRENQEPPNSNHLNIIKSTIEMLRTMVDYIVIDGGYLDRTLLQYVISESDITFLVGNPDVVSLKGLVTFFSKLKDLKYDTNKIKILINRYNSKNQIDAREFEKMLKHPITATLPNNYMLCIEAVNSGQTMTEIQEKSDLVKKINELADLVKKVQVQ